jgi:preprotein translocase subunit SecG
MLLLGAWFVSLLAFLFAFVCLLMMLVILIQKPRGGGLSGAFGGAGGSANAVFGSKTGDMLTLFTVSCFVLFLLLAMGLTWLIPTGNQNPAVITPTTPASAPANPGSGNGGVVPKTPAEESSTPAPSERSNTAPAPAPAPTPAPSPAPAPTPAPSDGGK